MNKIIAMGFSIILVTGCSSIEVVDVMPLDRKLHNPNSLIVINNPDVHKNDFVTDVFERWSRENGIKYILSYKGDVDATGEYVLDYNVGWHWDGVNYINDAEMTLTYAGRQVGHTDLDSHGLLNFDKWQDDSRKLRLTLDSLFGIKTVEQVNELLD